VRVLPLSSEDERRHAVEMLSLQKSGNLFCVFNQGPTIVQHAKPQQKMCTRQNRIDRMATPLGRLSLQSFRATRWLALDHGNDEHLTDLIHLTLKTFI